MKKVIKRIIRRMPNHFFRMAVYRFFWLFVRLVFRLEVRGLENVPDSGPAILVANHTSMADMFVISTAIRPWVCWVAKKELFKSWILSKSLHLLGCIPVDRAKADTKAARGIIKALREQQIIGIFPQAHRVSPDKLALVSPHPGAVHFAGKTGAPLLPVAIDGQFGIFRKVRVVFGKPFHMENKNHYSSSEMEGLTRQLMQRIYGLIGKEYPLAAGTGQS
jgi:1-acyl-sn-glycerol-3-phosphate acyltransferase